MASSVALPAERAHTKEAWRERFRAYRTSLSPTTYRTRSALLTHHALTHSAVAAAGTVHVYWPLPEQGEVDTRPLVRALRGLGKTVVLPVVTSYDPAAPEMEHRRYDGPAALAPNQWGIQEPTDTPRVPPAALDVVLLPALGMDRQGTRIGQGGGYYDTFLPDVNAPRVALVYDACVVESLPADSHDVPATALVTERGRCSVSAA
jgi:5-formyltetrahydrofolate cyclo-ligase